MISSNGWDPGRVNRRRFLQAGGAGILGLGEILDPRAAPAATEGELVYNGIRLPSAWPPQIAKVPREPATPAYLTAPPAVIPIDVGRQLFVDDFLIAQTDLERTFHLAEYHASCPILKPDKPWEKKGSDGPVAMAFSDGVWYDPKDKLFKMWYMAGWLLATCYAVSEDGIRWKKPALDVEKGTNIVQKDMRDSSTVWLDQETKDPKQRYKMFRSYRSQKNWAVTAHFSADGIHWSDAVFQTGSCGDRTTVFWNPFRKVWVYSLRHGWGDPRLRRYWETRDLVKGSHWKRIDQPPLWTGADGLDPRRPDLKITPQLYNLDCVAYESLILGLFTIWRGHPRTRQKPNDIVLGFSRDGWSWHRPERKAFLPVSEKQGDWNYTNVQSAGGCCLVVGDKLYFYVSGRTGIAGKGQSGMCTTGLATLRRDGFASMDGTGTLTTRPIRFRGKHLFVNAACQGGELRVEALDEKGKTIAPFSKEGCTPIRADKTNYVVGWKGVEDLADLAGKTIKLRFHMTKGKLYAFWVSPDTSGASHGYVAAGGPRFKGPVDTVGLPV